MTHTRSPGGLVLPTGFSRTSATDDSVGSTPSTLWRLASIHWPLRGRISTAMATWISTSSTRMDRTSWWETTVTGTFTDLSNAHTGEIGFGMGGSWGDYDNDGRADMYTTNMFSKAGMRIAEQMQSSAIVTQSARGNSLIRNGADGFYKVSGMEPPAPRVEAADFGWGGGFADLNNDGYLDVYVPAGQVSMPPEVATIGDS